jgi:hypothetical protein
LLGRGWMVQPLHAASKHATRISRTEFFISSPRLSLYPALWRSAKFPVYLRRNRALALSITFCF